MKLWRAILLLFLFTGVTLAAHAQDGLLHFAQFQPKDKSLEEQLGLTQPKPLPEGEKEQKAALAQRYSRDCLANPTPGLSLNAQRLLCGCAAKGMREKMSLPEVRGLYFSDEKSALYRKKFYTEIYGRCLALPMEHMVRQDCQNNAGLQKTKGKQKEKFTRACQCTADTVKRLMEQDGPVYMDRALSLDWSNPDPLAVLMNDKQFTRKRDGYLKRCITIHVDGLP